jgi:hypothetical protein
VVGFFRDGLVAVVVEIVVFDVDGVGIGSAVATSSLAALDRVVVLGAGVCVSGSVALAVVAAPVSFDKPGTLSITDPPLTGVETAAFIVEVEAAPVPGSLSVILEVPVDAEYSGRE